jgi:pimeloyl-ACP methyl ester carboxylesterase
MNMANDATNYLKFANVQLAAEALYGLQTETPGSSFSGDIPVEFLTIGNDHSSKFTSAQAAEFVLDWEVAEHISDTTTGFSGTLFRCLRTDEARGLKAGDLVLSFRSTEFIDDAARDNQATNSMEIKPFGWAFGQIADMKTWVDSLYARGKITGANHLDVTGYSLGGHLATAFSMLYPGDADGTYTFNGAGVGRLENGASLTTVIQQFDALRNPVMDLGSLFNDPAIRSLYESLRTTLRDGGLPTAEQRAAIALITPNTVVVAGITIQPLSTDPQAQMLIDAFNRVDAIQKEIARERGLSSGGASPTSPIVPADSAVEATNINYQIAVLMAAKNTSAINSDVLGAGYQGAFGRKPGPYTFNNFHDIYGYTWPSAVSNSQLHYGAATPVFIEDQPLWRGSIFWNAITESWACTRLLPE